MTRSIALAAAALLLSGCGNGQQQDQAPVRNIEVGAAEQARLHELNALDRSIALKRAIHDSSLRCKRITRSGFVGDYENLEMWTATCEDQRKWAIFVGPDGSAQVRDCKDVAEFGLPACEIKSEELGPGELTGA